MTQPMRKAAVELAYRLDLSETDCIAELARVCSGIFDSSEPTAAFSVTDDSQHTTLSVITSEDESLDSFLREGCSLLPLEAHLRVAQSTPLLTTASRMYEFDTLRRLERATGAPDFGGVVCPNGRGVVIIGNRLRAPRRFSAQQSRKWLPVAAHIGAAWRLRDALSSEPLAGLVFSADGALVDEGDAQYSAPASLRDVLRRAVTQRERLRAGDRDDLWPAIVAGEWILVDRFEASGRRHVVAYRCDALARPCQLLTRAESLALRRAIDGTASKVIASEMRVSDATVSRLIQRALSALGLRDLADALRLRAMAHSTMRIGSVPVCVHVGVLVDERPEAAHAVPDHIVGLTRAEREVLAAIVRGCSHRQVAALRGTTQRTVANQVASIFGKIGVGSRRELVARLLGGTLQGAPTTH